MLTLNLLPTNLKTAAQNQVAIRRQTRWLLIINGLALVSLLLVTSANYFLTRRLNNYQKQNQSAVVTHSSAAGDITTVTTTLNNSINQLTSILGQPRNWAQDLSTVYNVVPGGNTITALTVNDAGTFRLQGVASTRQYIYSSTKLLKARLSSPM